MNRQVEENVLSLIKDSHEEAAILMMNGGVEFMKIMMYDDVCVLGKTKNGTNCMIRRSEIAKILYPANNL